MPRKKKEQADGALTSETFDEAIGELMNNEYGMGLISDELSPVMLPPLLEEALDVKQDLEEISQGASNACRLASLLIQVENEGAHFEQLFRGLNMNIEAGLIRSLMALGREIVKHVKKRGVEDKLA